MDVAMAAMQGMVVATATPAIKLTLFLTARYVLANYFESTQLIFHL